MSHCTMSEIRVGSIVRLIDPQTYCDPEFRVQEIQHELPGNDTRCKLTLVNVNNPDFVCAAYNGEDMYKWELVQY